jgi:hypothetical protein
MSFTYFIENSLEQILTVFCFSDCEPDFEQGLLLGLPYVELFKNDVDLYHVLFKISQASEDLRAERDRRSKLEEALRSARVCVRCGHPRVFITGDSDNEVNRHLKILTNYTDNLLHLVNRESSERGRC